MVNCCGRVKCLHVITITQQAHNLKTTLYQHQCDVMTSHRVGGTLFRCHVNQSKKKQTLIICAPSKDSDQPRYPPSRTSLRCVHEESIHEALSTNGSFLSDLVDVHAGLRLSCYDPENSGGGGGGGINIFHRGSNDFSRGPIASRGGPFHNS